MVSIILPCYNSQNYVGQAIDSVIGQSYTGWELLIVDDGSTDNTSEIIKSRASGDKRITVFDQVNSGVSRARNVALSKARGEFICFLDSDDWLPPNSLEVRIRKFNESDSIDFVDGSVNIFSEDGSRIERRWKPAFRGNPHRLLLRLSQKVFFGPTWMIRVKPEHPLQFDEAHRYGEDLLFYIEASQNDARYEYVDEPVYNYRNRAGSTMKDTNALLEGYFTLRHKLVTKNAFNFIDRLIFEVKIKKIMFLTLVRQGKTAKAIQYFFR